MSESTASTVAATGSRRPRRGKRLAFWLCVLPVLPMVFAARIEQRVRGGERAFTACGDFLGLVPGYLGNFLRLAFYRLTLRRCSLDVTFNFGCSISHMVAEIGSNVCVGSHACIGTATLGDDVLIGSRVSILSGSHQHEAWSEADDLSNLEPHFERVHIGSHTWIGEGAIVAADVGERCVVAAGAVVLRASPDSKLIIGNPARVVSRKFSRGAVESEIATR